MKKNDDVEMLLADLMALYYRLNRKDFNIFLWFSGHVNDCTVTFHAGGWDNNKDGVKIPVVMTVAGILKVMDKLRQASDYNEQEQREAVQRLRDAEKAEYLRLKAKFSRKKAEV